MTHLMRRQKEQLCASRELCVPRRKENAAVSPLPPNRVNCLKHRSPAHFLHFPAVEQEIREAGIYTETKIVETLSLRDALRVLMHFFCVGYYTLPRFDRCDDGIRSKKMGFLVP